MKIHRRISLTKGIINAEIEISLSSAPFSNKNEAPAAIQAKNQSITYIIDSVSRPRVFRKCLIIIDTICVLTASEAMNSNLHVATEKSVYKSSGLIYEYIQEIVAAHFLHTYCSESVQILSYLEQTCICTRTDATNICLRRSLEQGTHQDTRLKNLSMWYIYNCRESPAVHASTALQIEYVTTLS